MLEVGLKATCEEMVTEQNTAKSLRSGLMNVYATPAMVALMEETSCECVSKYLEAGCGTVGTALNIKHVAATPVGMKVTCESELIKIDGRELTFSVKAYDECGLIGEGEHERFIIFEEKFQAKADAKIK